MSSQVEHKQARIAENGELTIPAEFRDELGLTPGATVMLVRVGGTLLLIPENTELEAALDRMSDFFQDRGITQADITTELAHIRQEEFARRHPDLAHGTE